MKTRLKYLIGLLVITISFSITSIVLGTNKVKAAGTGNIVLTQTYEVYEENDWNTYQANLNQWSGWDTDLAKWLEKAVDADLKEAVSDFHADGKFDMQDVFDAMAALECDIATILPNIAAANTAWAKRTALGPTMKASKDSSKTCYEYYGNKYPSDILGADYTGAISVEKPSKAQTAKPGITRLVAAVYITSTEPVYNYQVGPNLFDYAENVTTTNNVPTGWTGINSIGEQTYGSNTFYIYGAKAPSKEASKTFDNYLAMTVAFDVKSSASGECKVGKANFNTGAGTDQNYNNNTQVSDSTPTAYKAHGANLSHFAWNEATFTSGSTKSSNTDIKNITVTEQPSGTAKSATASSVTGVDYAVADDFTPSATFNMSYTVSDSGKVTWIEKSNDGSTWTDLSSSTGSSSSPVALTGNQNLSAIGLPGDGQELYLKFHITAENGTNTGTKVVRICTAPRLSGLSIRTDTGSGEAELVGDTTRFYQTASTSTHTFSPTVENYTIEIPYTGVAKTVKIATSYLSGQSAKVDGQSQNGVITNYVTVTIPAGETSASVNKSIVVTGKNGTSTKPYTITIKLLKDKQTLDNLAISYTKGSSSGTHNTNSSSVTGVDFEYTLDYTEELTGIIPTSTDIADIKVGLAKASATSVSSGSTYPISSGNAPTPGNYKDYYLAVTSKAGNTTEYVLRVTRAEPSSDATLSNLVFKTASGGSLSFTKNGTTLANSTEFTINGELDASATSFVFIPTFNSKASAAMTVGGATVSNAGSNTITIGAVSLTPISNDTVQFKITPESGASDAKTYTIKYSRKAANNDHTLKVELFSGSTAFATGTVDTATTAAQLVYTPLIQSNTLIMPAGYSDSGTGNLKYNVTSVDVKALYDTTKGIQLYNAAGSKINNNAKIDTISFGNASTVTADNTKTITFNVKSEYDALTGGAGQTYTLTVTRDDINDNYKYFDITYYYVDANGNNVYDGTGTTPFRMTESTTQDKYNSQSSNTKIMPFNVKEIHYTINRPASGVIPATTDIKVSGASIIGVEQVLVIADLSSKYDIPIAINHDAVTQMTTHQITLNFYRSAGQSGKTVSINARGATTNDPIPGTNNGSFGREFIVDPANDTKITLTIAPVTTNSNDLLNSDRAKIYVTDNASDQKKYEYGVDPDMQITVPSGYNTSTKAYVFVYPEDGSAPQQYSVDVYRKDNRSPKNGITNIEFIDSNGDPVAVLKDGSADSFVYNASDLSYTLRVPYSTDTLKFKVTTEDGKAKLIQPSSVLTDSSNTAVHTFDKALTNTGSTPNTVKIQAQAENGTASTKIYEFKIYRDNARTGNLITTLKINNVSLPNANVYFASNDSYSKNVLDAGAPLASFPVEFTVSDGATWTATDFFTSTANANVSVTDGKATFKITVTSEAGIPKTYTFNLYSAYEDFTLSNIELFKDSSKTEALEYDASTSFVYNAATTSYTVRVPYSNPTATVVATVGSTAYKSQGIYIDGAKLSAIDVNNGDLVASKDYSTIAIHPTTTEVKVLVKSQYAELNPAVTNQQKEYKIVISRTPADNDSSLRNLEVTAGGKTFAPTFVSTTTTGYKIEEVNAASATFLAVPNSSKATVELKTTVGGKGESISGTTPLSINTTGTETLTFKVTAEDKTTTTYEVVISKDKITQDTINTIADISVFANGNASKNLMVDDNTYLDTKTSYTIEIPGTEQGVRIQATPTLGTATITFNGTPASNKNTANKTYLIAEGGEETVVIGCNAENGDPNPVNYTIKIIRKVRDTNSNLDVLTVDSKPLEAPYKIHLPYGTTSTTIGATAESDKATVTGTGVVQTPNYENHFTVTITAEDGTKNNITVTVYVDEPITLSILSVKDLLTSTEHISGYDPNKNLYKMTFDYDMDTAEILFMPTGNMANGLTITLDGTPFPTTKKLTKAVEVGPNTFELKVENGSTYMTYTLEINRLTGNGDNFILEYIKAGTKRDDLGVMPKADDWNSMENTYQYVVGRDVTEIYFNALSDAQVEAGEDIQTITTGHYTMKISPNATVKSVLPNTTTLNLGTNVFTIDIESQTGHVNTYTITVVRADIECEIINIELLTSSSSNSSTLDVDGLPYTFIKETKTYEFNVPYSTDKTFLKVTKTNTAKAYLDSGTGYQVFANSLQAIDEGTQIFTIKCTAEVESYISTDTYVSDEYTIKINRALPGNDPSLVELHAVVTKTNGEKVDILLDKFASDKKNYIIENLDQLVEPNIASIDITAVATLRTTKVENILHTYNKNYSLPAFSGEGVSQTGYVFKFNIKTEAENHSKDEYNINICRGPLDLSDSRGILAVVVTDSNGNKYLGNDNTYNEKFDADTRTYSYTLPYPTQSFTIDILKDNQYDTSTKNGTGQYTIPTDLAVGEEKNYVVFLTSEKGNDSDKYTVNIKVEAPSSDARLLDFIVGGKSGIDVFEFDPDTEAYTYPSKIPYNESLITIEGIPVDPKATVNPSVETEKTLKPGDNTLSITVTAQDGTQKTYSLLIKRDYPDAFLNDIAVSTYTLYNNSVFEEENIIEEFNKDIKEIYVIVPNEITNAPISIEVPDKSYQTTCTNSSQSHPAGTDINRQFTDLQFAEGMNNFTIEATSGQGKKVQYNVHVNRLGKQATLTTVAGINIIPRSQNNRNITSTVNDYLDDEGLDSTKENDNVSLFNADMFNKDVVFEYKVPNRVTSLSINVDPEVASLTGSGLKQEVEILGNDKLNVGTNQVVIIIKSADGQHSRAVVLNVVREEMDYEVKATGDQIPLSSPKVSRTAEDGTKLTTVDISLGNTVLKDDEKTRNLFLDYIKYDDSNNNITTEVLSDLTDPSLKQVLVKVTDGDVSDLVAFNLVKNGLDYTVRADANQVKITEESVVNYPSDGSKNTIVRIGLKAIEEQLKTKLGDKDNLAAARKLFTDYVKAAEGVDDIVVEVISDLTDPNLTEVLVKVTNGEDTDLVTFKLDNVSLSAESVLDLIKTWWPLFIGILAAIILLVLILISVNRDKYGKINKNRKNAD